MNAKRSVWAIVLCMGAVLPARAVPHAWYLYPTTCTGGAATVVIPCGAYGRYLIGQTQDPGCPWAARGDETTVLGYPPDHVQTAFPVRAPRLREVVLPVEEEPQPLASFTPLQTTGTRSGGVRTTSVVGTAPPPPSNDWIAVLDFDDAHGDSTTYLADRVGGDSVAATLVPLDPPDLTAALGHVGDFHVLAGLCAVADVVDNHSLPAPKTINMSFGRLARVAPDPHPDPVSVADCPNPDGSSVACEITKVVHYLRTKTLLVAAAGNHRAALFPGSLADVISVGMLDPTPYFDSGLTRAAWETPAGADAWIPGSALCLGSWAAPAGSSYSSAMFAAWVVRVLDHPVVWNSLGTSTWMPFSNGTGCDTLGREGHATTYCNQAISDMFGPLTGNAAPCWDATAQPTVTAPIVVRPGNRTNLRSLDSWGDPTHPTPESDPCVPCSGVMVVGPTGTRSLVLDLSKSGALPQGIFLDEVTLRVDDDYLPLDLSEDQLGLLATGDLGKLVIPDADVVLRQDASLSLWYRLKGDVSSICENPDDCFWSSTPLLVDK